MLLSITTTRLVVASTVTASPTAAASSTLGSVVDLWPCAGFFAILPFE